MSPPGRPVHLDFSVKHSPTLQLLHEDYAFTYPPLSIASYSLIELSELGQCGVKETVQASKKQREDSNPDSVVGESDILPATPPRPTSSGGPLGVCNDTRRAPSAS